MLDPTTLPDDVETLRRMIAEAQQDRLREIEAHQRHIAELDREIEARRQEIETLAADLGNEIHTRDLTIEKLRVQLARALRLQYGRSSEKLTSVVEQLQLLLEDVETTQADSKALLEEAQPAATAPAQPLRKPLPAHLPREAIVHQPACTCPSCGGELRRLGEDVTELLEYVPASFRVIQHVRPKLSCRTCETIVQAPLPSLPIERGRPGPGLLAHVLVAKYADHLPLYRQSEIYAREGVELERSTLADWVGRASRLLDPLVDVLGQHALAGATLHADDTPVPVLAPGNGKTRTGRLWVYVRDERGHDGDAAPAAFFRYSPDRKGDHPGAHLAAFRGRLHADGYSGFEKLYGDRIDEVACWAHTRRKFHDVFAATQSKTAHEALDRIQTLYAIEDEIRGKPPDERQRIRQTRAGPALIALKQWLDATLPRVSGRSDLAGAMRYALHRWDALVRYTNDGTLEIDNNVAERALRGVALGRKNYLFAGSDRGGERAANIYSLIETAKLNGIDPEAYLRDVIARIADHPAKRIAELLPWNWAKLQQLAQAA